MRVSCECKFANSTTENPRQSHRWQSIVNPGSEIINFGDWVVDDVILWSEDINFLVGGFAYLKIHKTEILNFKRVGGFASVGKFGWDYGIFFYVQVFHLISIYCIMYQFTSSKCDINQFTSSWNSIYFIISQGLPINLLHHSCLKDVSWSHKNAKCSLFLTLSHHISIESSVLQNFS